jgi:PAS domain S-box-containing protein
MLVRYLPDAPKFTTLGANDIFFEFYGFDPDKFAGQSILFNVHQDEHAIVIEKLRKVIHDKTVLVSTEKNIRSDGKIVIVRWADRPILDDHGNITEMLAIGEPV